MGGDDPQWRSLIGFPPFFADNAVSVRGLRGLATPTLWGDTVRRGCDRHVHQPPRLPLLLEYDHSPKCVARALPSDPHALRRAPREMARSACLSQCKRLLPYCETGVLGQGFVQIVAELRAHRDAVGHDPHELPLAAHVLEKHHQNCNLKKTTGSTDGLPSLA